MEGNRNPLLALFLPQAVSHCSKLQLGHGTCFAGVAHGVDPKDVNKLWGNSSEAVVVVFIFDLR